MAGLVVSSLASSGVNVHSGCEPQLVERGSNGRLEVSWRDQAQQESCVDVFDTVLFATGQSALDHCSHGDGGLAQHR